jgi:hypothetical protein
VAGPAKTPKTAKTLKTPPKAAKPTGPVLGDAERKSLNSLIPHPSDFAHVSKTHGQAHVGRVMVHAFRLIDAVGLAAEACGSGSGLFARSARTRRIRRSPRYARGHARER